MKLCEICGADLGGRQRKFCSPECRVIAEAARDRARHLARRYGVSDEEYAALLALQDGRCAICRNRPRTRRLSVDHNHKTHEVRGLLCSICNHKLLGAAHDSIPRLQAAIQYLTDPPARGLYEHEHGGNENG